MADTVSLRVGLSFRWWVRPLLRAALIAALLHLPVSTDRLGRLIATHGVRYHVASRAADPVSGAVHG